MIQMGHITTCGCQNRRYYHIISGLTHKLRIFIEVTYHNLLSMKTIFKSFKFERVLYLNLKKVSHFLQVKNSNKQLLFEIP